MSIIIGDNLRNRLNLTDTGLGPSNRDIVTDFEVNVDRFELWRMVDGLIFAGNLDSTPFSGIDPEVGYTQGNGMTIVQIDSNGNDIADLEIELTGVHTLTLGDFELV